MTALRSFVVRVLAALIALPAANVAVEAATVFINVDVLPMDTDAVLERQTVVVEDGRIAVIGPVDRVPVPKGAFVVDGTDRFLIPGLAEMHAHVPYNDDAAVERVLALYAANGVTIIRGMLGHPSHLALRQRLNDGKLFGPRLVTSGPSMNGTSVNGAEDAARKVREQHAAGFDFIKIHPGLSTAEFAAIAATSSELGMRFAGHVPEAVGVRSALASGMATIDHLDGYLAAMMPADSDQSGGYGGFFDVLLADQVEVSMIPELAARTATAGTWNVPTESLFEHCVANVTTAELRAQPEMRFMPVATVAKWAETRNALMSERGFDPRVAARAIDIRRRLILALHDAGAGLLLGSDSPQVFNVPGFSIHQELEFLVAAGLTPFQALQTGTTAVADFLHTNTGVIAVGRDADLVLLDASPLEEIGNTRRIHGVMLRGSWHAAADLERRLAAIRASVESESAGVSN
jgi:imidazolonepropionase-like amidohydrolase